MIGGMGLACRSRTAGAFAAGAVIAFTLATGPKTAEAHGPCDCLDPRVAPAGGVVRLVGSEGHGAGTAAQPAYRIVFNPGPEDLGIAPSYLAGAFRVDAPSKVVLERPQDAPTRRARFRVPPDTPPGLYMVLIFDGDEGGAHNTWDYVHVFDTRPGVPAGVVTAERTAARSPSTTTAARAATVGGDGAAVWPWVLLAAAAAAVTGFAVGRRGRR
jgi:hypothetical protein